MMGGRSGLDRRFGWLLLGGVAGLGALVFLEHDDACAFTHDEAITILVIGTRGSGGIVVETGRERAGCGFAWGIVEGTWAW